MTVFRHVATVAAILIEIGMRFHMAIQHGLVNACVTAVGLRAFERFRAGVISGMVFQMVLVFRYEGAPFDRTEQLFLRFNVHSSVAEIFCFRQSDEIALFTTVGFRFPSRTL